MSTTPPPACRLLELPAELRTIIWELVLTIPPDTTGNTLVPLVRRDNADIQRDRNDEWDWMPYYMIAVFHHTSARFPTPDLLGPSVLALLRTCRQINDEASGIFYAQNHISVRFDGGTSSDPLAPTMFYNILSQARLGWITRLTISTIVHKGGPEGYMACLACRFAVRLPRLRVFGLQGTAAMLGEKTNLKKAIEKLEQVDTLVFDVRPWDGLIETIVEELMGALPKARE